MFDELELFCSAPPPAEGELFDEEAAEEAASADLLAREAADAAEADERDDADMELNTEFGKFVSKEEFYKSD